MACTYLLSDTYHEVTDRIVGALKQRAAPWVCPRRRDGEGASPQRGPVAAVVERLDPRLSVHVE